MGKGSNTCTDDMHSTKKKYSIFIDSPEHIVNVMLVFLTNQFFDYCPTISEIDQEKL
jgi:hypothetical protein